MLRTAAKRAINDAAASRELLHLETTPHMTHPADADFGHQARQLRVDTLIFLRWLAITGQTIATLVDLFLFSASISRSA